MGSVSSGNTGENSPTCRANEQKTYIHVNAGIMGSHSLSQSITRPRRSNGNSLRSTRLWKTSSTSLNVSIFLIQTTTQPRTDPTHPAPPGSSSAVLILAFAQPTFESGTQRPSMLHGPPPAPWRLKSTCRATGKRLNVLSLGTAPTIGSPSRNISTMCSPTAVNRRSTISRFRSSPPSTLGLEEIRRNSMRRGTLRSLTSSKHLPWPPS